MSKQVEEILEQYRQALNEYNIIMENFDRFKETLALHRTGNIESERDVIEGMSMSAKVIDDMPKGGGGFSSKTENSAYNYLRYLKPSELEIKAIQDMVNEREDIINRCNDLRKTVNKMLIILTEENRFITEHLFFDKKSYNNVIRMVREKFPNSTIYSPKSVEFRKKKILKDMAKLLEN